MTFRFNAPSKGLRCVEGGEGRPQKKPSDQQLPEPNIPKRACSEGDKARACCMSGRGERGRARPEIRDDGVNKKNKGVCRFPVGACQS